MIHRAIDTKEKTSEIINNLYKDTMIDSGVKFRKKNLKIQRKSKRKVEKLNSQIW